MNLDQQNLPGVTPEIELNSLIEKTKSAVEEIRRSVKFGNLPEKKDWPNLLNELKEGAGRLQWLEDVHGLSTTDKVPSWPQGIRRYLLEALGELFIPKKMTDEERVKLENLIRKYRAALSQWQTELVERLCHKNGIEREVIEPEYFKEPL